ncbi:CNVH-domain-containing protein [Microthyrium microscopicum]|uniref:CNVH-domain-containing protein n=1 Tax=Microthyrium microscopicum TaxID=703497 RepID=A0A6A6U320_9PEZI|nr:CNVH-domain-containing protein [Microthyrium microscopicum]
MTQNQPYNQGGQGQGQYNQSQQPPYNQQQYQNQPPYGQQPYQQGQQPYGQSQYNNQSPQPHYNHPNQQYNQYTPPPGQYTPQPNQQSQYTNQSPYPPPQPSPYEQGQAASYYNPSSNRPNPPALSPSALANKPTNPTDEERGLMGALAGGAAGGYAGHKMHHGIIGTVGGAYAGHKLEDAYKNHNKPTPPSPNNPATPQQPYGGAPPAYDGHNQHHGMPANMQGNFSGSAEGVNLDRDFDLIANCRAVDGSMRMSAISLNKVVGNDNGRFNWVREGGNFGASARNVRLVENGRILEGELRDVEGRWVWSRLWLDERIGNNDGELCVVGL